mmetsp:Transcript_27355/g.63813  ORF Transcript_27355/g.63813 Transcript_27355/m.63813 type:complete len:258 (+) Transcript_27355:1031-1804(+)
MDLVAFVRGFGKAFQGTCLNNGLAELNDRIGNLDLKVAIEASQVVQNAVKVNLTRTHDNMLTTFFHFRGTDGIRLVNLPQAVNHLWQFGRLQRLDRHLDNGRCRKFQWLEDLNLFLIGGSGNGGGLLDSTLNATNQNPVSGWYMTDLHSVPALVNPQVRNLADAHVLIIIQRERLSQDLDTISAEKRSRHDATKDVKGVAVWTVVVLHSVDHEVPGVVQLLHVSGNGALHVARVKLLCLVLSVCLRTWDVVHDHVNK